MRVTDLDYRIGVFEGRQSVNALQVHSKTYHLIIKEVPNKYCRQNILLRRNNLKFPNNFYKNPKMAKWKM